MVQSIKYNLLLAASLQMSFSVDKLPIKAKNLLNNFRKSEIPPIIYIKGKSCSGCSISIMNFSNQATSKLIINHDDLFAPKMYTSPYNLAVDLMRRYISGKSGPYFFALEGSIPKNPIDCYMANYPICHWIKNAGKTAISSITIGNCATYGSPDSDKDSKDTMSLKEFYRRENINNPIINISGCPIIHENIWNKIIDLINIEHPAIHLMHQKEFIGKNL